MMIRAHDPSITPTTLNTYILNGIIKSHNLLIIAINII